MFDKERYSSITSILRLELENLITKDELDEIKKELGEKYEEVVHVSPQMAYEIRKTIEQVNDKTIKEAEDRGISLGISQGEESKESQMLNAIRNAPKDKVDSATIDFLLEYIPTLR